MIYCPACQPQDAGYGWLPVLCTACADKLARDRRERANAARREQRIAEGDQAAIALDAADRRECRAIRDEFPALDLGAP